LAVLELELGCLTLARRVLLHPTTLFLCVGYF
jgi:hypothetical protein